MFPHHIIYIITTRISTEKKNQNSVCCKEIDIYAGPDRMSIELRQNENKNKTNKKLNNFLYVLI